MDHKRVSVGTRHLYFALLLVLCALVFHQSLSLLVGSSLSDDRYSHIILVWPVSLVLLFLGRKKILAKAAYSPVAGGIALLFIACSATVMFTHGEAITANAYQTSSILLFISSCLAIFVLCYGTAAFRSAAFPLLFLLLTVPLPDFILQPSISFLQDTSGDATCALYRIAHVPYVRHGIVLSLAKLDIQIAEECSGIHSTMVLVLSSLVLGHLYLKSGWSKALLTLSVVPITIAKNGLRIFVLSTLGTYWDPSFLTGRLHHQGGFIFFGLAFAGLLLLIWIFQKVESRFWPVNLGASASEPALKASL
jgi:exosortase